MFHNLQQTWFILLLPGNVVINNKTDKIHICDEIFCDFL